MIVDDYMQYLLLSGYYCIVIAECPACGNIYLITTQCIIDNVLTIWITGYLQCAFNRFPHMRGPHCWFIDRFKAKVLGWSIMFHGWSGVLHTNILWKMNNYLNWSNRYLYFTSSHAIIIDLNVCFFFHVSCCATLLGSSPLYKYNLALSGMVQIWYEVKATLFHFTSRLDGEWNGTM